MATSGKEREALGWTFLLPLRGGVLVPVLAALTVAGCGGGGAQEPVAGSFVGETSDPVASVAVVAAEPEEGEDAREVRALIYGYTENWIVEWFVGSAAGTRPC